jgi:hypothetical protein
MVLARIARTMKTNKALEELVNVRFPALNKNETLQENDSYIEENSSVSRCRVQKIVCVPPMVYDALGETLLDDNSIWEKIGGIRAGKGFSKVTIEQLWKDAALMTAYKKVALTNVVKVTDGKREFFVNTEGYSYARYVGRRA